MLLLLATVTTTVLASLPINCSEPSHLATPPSRAVIWYPGSASVSTLAWATAAFELLLDSCPTDDRQVDDRPLFITSQPVASTLSLSLCGPTSPWYSQLSRSGAAMVAARGLAMGDHCPATGVPLIVRGTPPLVTLPASLSDLRLRLRAVLQRSTRHDLADTTLATLRLRSSPGAAASRLVVIHLAPPSRHVAPTRSLIESLTHASVDCVVAQHWLAGSKFFVASAFPWSLVPLRAALGPGNVYALTDTSAYSQAELIAAELLIAAEADIIVAPHDSSFGAVAGVLAGRQPWQLNPAFWDDQRDRRDAQPCVPMAHEDGVPEVLLRSP